MQREERVQRRVHCLRDCVGVRVLYSPSILEILELCISGHALSILRRSSRAHTMNAFIGRLM